MVANSSSPLIALARTPVRYECRATGRGRRCRCRLAAERGEVIVKGTTNRATTIAAATEIGGGSAMNATEGE